MATTTQRALAQLASNVQIVDANGRATPEFIRALRGLFGLETEITALQAADVVIDGRLDTLEATDVAYDTRLDSLEASDVVIDGRLDGLDAADVAIDARLDDLERGPGGVTIPDFTMLSGTVPASRRWEYADTSPNGWNEGVGQMVFTGDFLSTNYFTLNPNGHIPIGLRCDTATVGTTPRFAGIVLGNLSGAVEGAPNYPTTQIEVRATGLDPGGALRMLFPNSEGPVTKPLLDATQYRVRIRVTALENNVSFVRYQLWRYNTTHTAWDLEVDSGDMLSPNTWLDLTQQGLVFASVFEDDVTPGDWSVAWTNCNVVWSDANEDTTDVSARVLGSPSTRLTGLNNVGGAEALILTTGAQNLETYCTPGNISAAAQAAYTGAGGGAAGVGAAIELITRPAFGMVSSLVADLQDRKVN